MDKNALNMVCVPIYCQFWAIPKFIKINIISSTFTLSPMHYSILNLSQNDFERGPTPDTGRLQIFISPKIYAMVVRRENMRTTSRKILAPVSLEHGDFLVVQYISNCPASYHFGTTRSSRIYSNGHSNNCDFCVHNDFIRFLWNSIDQRWNHGTLQYCVFIPQKVCTWVTMHNKQRADMFLFMKNCWISIYLIFEKNAKIFTYEIFTKK